MLGLNNDLKNLYISSYKRAGTSLEIRKSSGTNLESFKTSRSCEIESSSDIGVARHQEWCRSSPTRIASAA